MRFERDGMDQEVADAARTFLAGAWPIPTLRDRLPAEPVPDDVWNQAVELGWIDIIVGEQHGGLGLGAVAAGALMEEAGRALFPGPLLETVVTRGLLAGYFPTSLPERVTLAVAEPQSKGLPGRSLEFRDGMLFGRKVQVPHADVADLLVATATTPGGTLALVTAEATSAAIARRHSIDPVHVPCDVDFEGAAAHSLVEGPEAELLVGRITALSLALLASRMLGVGERALELGVEYACVREQFGRPIGSFQAVRHRLAEGQMMMTAGRSACYLAQARIEAADPDAARAAHVAKAYLSQVGRRVVEDSLQVHGGIGFTVDHDLHLYLQHALTLQGLWGDEAVHALALADDLILRTTTTTTDG